jgi:hypothetical protein
LVSAGPLSVAASLTDSVDAPLNDIVALSLNQPVNGQRVNGRSAQAVCLTAVWEGDLRPLTADL